MQSPFPYPDESNGFLLGHARVLRLSHRSLTGRDLIDPALDDRSAARALFEAPFALLSHDASEDPVLSYGNLAALRLFELDWPSLVTMHSRLTAEAPSRDERARLLARVAERGYVDDYAGVRISAKGRRFRILGAMVWNLADWSGARLGQAAAIARWEPL
jgi:hypothetical protein